MDAGQQLAALADPTRRAIFESLARRPMAVGALAQKHPVSRPAVSQHLKVLSDAGLVRSRPDGTRRIYSVDPKGMEALRQWLESTWDVVLDHFEAAARRELP
ncbi:MAG TPA: metalloregulator ArsR/SmtB family transcription factor [Acidimicrobiia bacterium]|jgi:DNA-binding transcriptional ArsR family regulator